MNAKKTKQPNHFKGLIAATGLALTVYGLHHIENIGDMTFAIGALLLAATLYAAEDIWEHLIKHLFTFRLSDHHRKSLQRIRKSLSDFNRSSETPYSSFSEAGINHKRTNRLAKKLRRKDFGEVRALFGWKQAATPLPPSAAAHPVADIAAAKPLALMQSFMVGANRVVVMEWPNGSFETVAIVAPALAAAAATNQQKAHPHNQAANHFNHATDATPEEIEESLRRIWEMSAAESAGEDDGNATQTSVTPVVPPRSGGGF